MLHLGWLVERAGNVPTDEEWLSPAEAALLSRLAVPKRRADWLLGRWAAKRALQAWFGGAAGPAGAPPGAGGSVTASRLGILPAEDGAPEAWLDARPLGADLSITHRDGVAVCAVAPPGVGAGCDLEVVEPRDPPFVQDYFTAREMALVAREPSAAARAMATTLIWSAKESALKVLRVGLRADTRDVDVQLSADPRHGPWQSLRIWHAERRQVFFGWWRGESASGRRYVLTIATSRPTGPPRSLGRRSP